MCRIIVPLPCMCTHSAAATRNMCENRNVMPLLQRPTCSTYCRYSACSCANTLTVPLARSSSSTKRMSVRHTHWSYLPCSVYEQPIISLSCPALTQPCFCGQLHRQVAICVCTYITRADAYVLPGKVPFYATLQGPESAPPNSPE